jgi:hypothetical protein
MINNKRPISYSTRDYNTVLSQIESDAELKEYPTRFKRLLAGVFDVINNTINAVANALIPSTAYDRTILQDILALFGYDLGWKSTSNTLLEISINPDLTIHGSYTLIKDDIIASTPSTISRRELKFEARSNLVFPQSTSSSSIIVYQQESQPEKSLNPTDGTSWQKLDLPDLDILPETIILKINNEIYYRVINFASSLPTDRHYKIYFRSDGSSYIKLGGVDQKTGVQFGFIPTAGQQVLIEYAVGGGSDTNVALGEVNRYLGTNSNVLSVINSTNGQGGAPEESILNAVELTPLRLRSGAGYFINESSAIALAREISGVLDVLVVKTGLLAVDIYVIPNGGGLPTVDLKNAVKTKLEKASLMEEVIVTTRDPQYIDIGIIINAKLISGIEPIDVIPYLALMAFLKSTEFGRLIYGEYYSGGINRAIAIINQFSPTIGYTYGISGSAKIKALLDNVPLLGSGKSLHPEDFIRYSAFVTGIDYIKVISPSSEIVLSTGQVIRPVSIGVGLIT